ncbi:MAG TPA: polyhydroxyalkanoate synthesis regulator DNA-binding domain-containing protein [Bryobacteraceae bacterium]|nr:polyhydroxyalkanoate synthesis regulator DNA-binding domain-containing protein [Bryobacteraceae bacterium]
MARVIKRYENRKLYDTAAKRYVSLEDIAGLVRQGEEISVLDNASGSDLTSSTLAKVISGETAGSEVQPEFLHQVLRFGNRFVAGGVEGVQQGLDRLIEASIERLGPVREVRKEMTGVRERLEKLERLVEQLTAEERNVNNTESTDGRSGEPAGGNQT